MACNETGRASGVGAELCTLFWTAFSFNNFVLTQNEEERNQTLGKMSSEQRLNWK